MAIAAASLLARQSWSAALLWLIGIGVAHGQLNDPAPTAAPAGKPGAIVLGAENEVLPLDRLSVYWIDPGGRAGIDQVEAAGDTLPW